MGKAPIPEDTDTNSLPGFPYPQETSSVIKERASNKRKRGSSPELVPTDSQPEEQHDRDEPRHDDCSDETHRQSESERNNGEESNHRSPKIRKLTHEISTC